MKTLRAVIRRDRNDGSLLGWFRDHPQSQVRGSNLDEMEAGLHDMACALSRGASDGVGGGEEPVVETVSVL